MHGVLVGTCNNLLRFYNPIRKNDGNYVYNLQLRHGHMRDSHFI